MKKEGKKVVISTVYSGKAIKVAIKELSPNKLILIVDKPIDKIKEETVKEIKKFYGEVMEIETLQTSLYDIPEIMEKVIKVIDEESGKGNEVLIHITEGRKTTSLALLFAGYARKEKLKGAYYVIEETNQILPLPLINLNLGESKKLILREIYKGNIKIEELIKKTKIKQSAVYQHLQELKKEGYLENNKELKLTDLGRIMIL